MKFETAWKQRAFWDFLRSEFHVWRADEISLELSSDKTERSEATEAMLPYPATQPCAQRKARST
jgi:hypothetical protein